MGIVVDVDVVATDEVVAAGRRATEAETRAAAADAAAADEDVERGAAEVSRVTRAAASRSLPPRTRVHALTRAPLARARVQMHHRSRSGAADGPAAEQPSGRAAERGRGGEVDAEARWMRR